MVGGRREGVVPAWVERADEGREGDGFIVEERGGVWVGGYTVIVCVEGFDEVRVELCVEEVGGGGVGGEGETVGDDGAGEVFVDQACGGELGFVRGGEGFGEGALVVVEVLGAVVLALDLGGGGG